MDRITEHILEHIKGLEIALESTDHPEEIEYINRIIAQYRDEMKRGYVPPECLPFIPND